MCRKLVVAVILALVLAPTAAARPTFVMPGVTYERVLNWTPAGPMVAYVVTAPKPGGLYSLKPLLGKAILGRETVSSMQRGASAEMTSIGVVGDFSSFVDGHPSGLLIRGGVVEHQPVPGRASIGVDTTGLLHLDRVPWFTRWHGPVFTEWHPIPWLNSAPRPQAATLYTPIWGGKTPKVRGVAAVLDPFPATLPRRDLTGTVTSVVNNTSLAIPPQGAVLVGRGIAEQRLLEEAQVGSTITVRIPLPEAWATVTDAVSGGPSLVKEGRPIFNAGEALTRAQLQGRSPRTAIGQRADGSIVMVVVDGRRPGWSIGITNWQLALMMVRYGCVTAFALDSGGSASMAFDGKLLNRPSDRYGERPVGEALVIAYTGVYVPPLAPTLSPNGDAFGDHETLPYKLVRTSTVSSKLIAPDGTARELEAGQKPAGRYTLSWDGLDPATGAPAPEGRYHWNITATDEAGQVSTHDRAFNVDNTLGFVKVSPNARQVAFTLTRDANVRVTLETRYGSILRTVAKGVRPPGPVTATWNGRDGRGKRVKRGTYVLRVAATTALGESQVRLPLRIAR